MCCQQASNKVRLSCQSEIVSFVIGKTALCTNNGPRPGRSHDWRDNGQLLISDPDTRGLLLHTGTSSVFRFGSSVSSHLVIVFTSGDLTTVQWKFDFYIEAS